MIVVQVSYLATDSLFPEWKIWSQFLHETTEGLKLDGLAESHPIEVLLIFYCIFGFPILWMINRLTLSHLVGYMNLYYSRQTNSM